MTSLEARKNRLILELRNSGIGDPRVLAAIERVPREIFVPECFRERSYQNLALPIGHGQTVSQPLVVAQMSEALDVGDRMKVLEIGTGSGYQAAVLSRLCRRLYTIERHRPLLLQAEQRFHALHIHNITTICGDGTRGWPDQAPFDRIMITAAASDFVPPVLYDQLAEGGIMVLPMGKPGKPDETWLVRVRKTAVGPALEDLAPTRFVPLVGGPLPDRHLRGPQRH